MGTVATHNIEDRRRQEQTRLDSLKTTAERNKWGQFATPPELALSLSRYAQLLMGKTQVRFLDPAIGTGSFFSAGLESFGQEHIAVATGIELDPLFARVAAELWEGRGLRVINGDFTKQPTPSQGYNLVLTNPPYVRHHHLTSEEKDRLKSRLALTCIWTLAASRGFIAISSCCVTTGWKIRGSRCGLFHLSLWT
jgi:hypothetical protein